MMASPPQPISVIAPLAPAFERVKTILFRPFDLEKWITIGFCAWLAYLSHGLGGGGGGGHVNLGHRHQEVRHQLAQAKEWVLNNLHWIIPLAAVLLLLGLALWCVLTWLSSRGQFMFLHCVARNRAEVRNPWNTYATHGNSLFLFRIVLGAITLLLMAPGLVACVWQIASIAGSRDIGPALVLTAVAIGILIALVGLTFAAVRKITLDFVVPIMSLGGSSCWAAWREAIVLFAPRAASILLYLLFQVALHVAIGILIVMVVLVTCCVAGCFLVLPYVGTVLLLPILVFERSYSLYYLAQFGPQYDLFADNP